MKKSPIILFPLLLVLADCGGSGSAAPKSPASQSPPVISASPQYVHRIISLSSGRQLLEVVPNGSSVVVPNGMRDGGTVAGAYVTYPDGSLQTASQNGGFDPSTSAYATRYAAVLKQSAMAQPAVIVADPQHAAQPATAIVNGFVSVHQLHFAKARMIRQIGVRDSSGGGDIGGVVLLPDTASLSSDALLNLNLEGVDSNNNVLDVSGADIRWSAQAGQVVAYGGTGEALYLPPTLAAGTLADTITVTLTTANGTSYSASSRIAVVSPSAAALVSGAVYANGATVPNAVTLFTQAGLPQFFTPDYWLAQAGQNGSYAAQLPSNARFSLAEGLPGGSIGNADFQYFVGATPAGGASFASGPAGSSATQDVALTNGAVPFTDLPPQLHGELPSYVGFVRDAWFETSFSAFARIFEADSGVQSLLQNVPTTFPTPAQPAPLASGQLRDWCYQWQAPQGVATLVVIENMDGSCSTPGNMAYTVTPAGNSTYSFAAYVSAMPYSLSGTPDVTTALLYEAGTWTQSLTGTNPITSDTASVTLGLYDKENQNLGSPIYTESLSYQYTLDGTGLATATLSNDTRQSAYDGSVISVLNATKTQTAQLGPSGCQNGSAATCYSISGSVAENATAYAVNDIINGDGSGTLTYQNTAAGDGTKMTFPLASYATVRQSHCFVCPSQAATMFDSDGTTPIGTVTITDAKLAQVSIYDTPPGTSLLGPDIIDTLAFVL